MTYVNKWPFFYRHLKYDYFCPYFLNPWYIGDIIPNPFEVTCEWSNSTNGR